MRTEERSRANAGRSFGSPFSKTTEAIARHINVHANQLAFSPFAQFIGLALVVLLVMLALFTAVVAMQVFRNNNQNVTFVYNSARTEMTAEVNIFDIFSEI